ncbi:phosphoribosylaminoimidazolesuccinocarboxamide synthase [Cooperia oncophora]
MESLLSWVANEENLTRIAEGKTKVIYKIKGNEEFVLIRSKDQLTAFNAARKNDLEGKAAIANKTTVNVFKLLKEIGIVTHFVTAASNCEFIARQCKMIPIEWVARRIATGSFLKRNPGVPEGYRFSEPKIETFYKDDANDDPQYSDEQILCSNFEFNGVKIGKPEINLMKRMTSVIFKVLERCWARHTCSLVDMKVEYGVTSKGEIVLADVIDNDSWRVWPLGDRRLQLDKQVYSPAFQVMETTFLFSTPPRCRALIIMGSPTDQAHCEKIAMGCRSLGITPILRVSSAHKTTCETLDIVAEYDDDETPTIIIAVAGRSNGLGPVLAGNFTLPVINCPPLTDDNMTNDIWSSLRMPSGLGCSTVLGADEAALCAAKQMARYDHMVFGRILAMQLNNAIKLLKADKSGV